MTVTPVAVTAAPTITIATDQTTYVRGQTATLTARLTAGGVPVASDAVAFTVVKANGARTTSSANTGRNGTVTFKVRLRKQDPVGTYQAMAQASVGGQVASALTTFSVQ